MARLGDSDLAITSALVEAMSTSHPTSVHDAISQTLESLDGVSKVDLWLADMSYTELLLMGSTERVSVDGTVVGRCFDRRELVETSKKLMIPIDSLGRTLGVLEVYGSNLVLKSQAEAVSTVVADRILALKGHTDIVEKIRGAARLDVAATIQHGLTPIPSYQDAAVEIGGQIEPAYEVAGDGFDYAVNEGVIDMALFDAVGHGLRATLLTTLTLGTYRLHRRRGADLIEISDEIERTIESSARDSEFVTGLLGRLDLTDHRFEITNAGHLPPVLIRDGRAIDVDLTPALPYGLERRAHEQRHVSLQPGDAMYFFSDGIVEARGSERAEYGTERMITALEGLERDVVPIPLICRRLLDSVVAHSGRLQDDATILGLRLAKN